MHLGRPNFGKICPIVLLVLALNALATDNVLGVTRGGLHFTQEEVNIWRERAANGPYKTAGDVNPYSPGDWERIKRNADAFLANPQSDRWDGGYQGSGCVPKWSQEPINPNKMFKIRDAAFVYLVTGESKYRDTVRNELLNYYVSHPKLDFSNRSRWCLASNSLNDVNPGFIIAEAMIRILFAYDYIRGTLTAPEQTRLNGWFRGAGDYFRQVVDQDLNGLFLNRANGTLKDPTAMANSTYAIDRHPITKTHDGGYDISKLSRQWNNRRATMVTFFAQVGVLLNDQTMIGAAKRFFQEWMKYGVFPDGTHNEWYRSFAERHEKGFGYTMSTIFFMISVADVIARAGDTSLYEFTTSDGFTQSKGGNKNLLLVMQNIGKYLDGTFKRYLQGKGGNEKYRMEGIEPDHPWYSIGDIYFSIANIYYKNDYLKNIYLRNQPGTNAYPSKPAQAGAWLAWQGLGGTLPGVLFMVGQMEGKVWPYGKSAGELQLPSKPATPRIEKH